jgi:LAS superfamily LD-carboxypeptidase LdcB
LTSIERQASTVSRPSHLLQHFRTNLDAMLAAGAAAGYPAEVISAYRSYQHQADI